MGSLLFEKVKTPNARLLFRESYGLGLDWNFHESKILQSIKTFPKLRLASNVTSLYFFSPPDEDQFSHATCWVAREIIGNVSSVEEFQVYDLDGGEAYRFHYKLSSPKDFLVSSIISFYGDCRSRLQQENIKIAEAWKLGISSGFQEQEAKVALWLDFFDETEEIN